MKPRAPSAVIGGAQGSARPQTKFTSGPARRMAWARVMTLGVAHFTPATPGMRHSASIAARPMLSLRR